MNIEEINAALGIDTGTASRDKLMMRAAQFCGEMADCYEPDTLENTAFYALGYALYRVLFLEANHAN